MSDLSSTVNPNEPASSLDINSYVIGEINSSEDRDLHAVYLTEGDYYQIDLEGADNGEGTPLEDPLIVALYNGDKELIEGYFDNDSGNGKNSRLAGSSNVTGLYYIEVASNDGGTGAYKLSVKKQDESIPPINSDDFSAGIDTEGTIDFNTTGTVTGAIETADDTDWFRVDLTADVLYEANLTSNSNSQNAITNPHIKALYNSAGERLVTYDISEQGQVLQHIEGKLDEDGVYYIEVSSNGNETGDYQLSVNEKGISVEPPAQLPQGNDDYGQTTANAGIVNIGSSISGKIETGDDQDWFQVTLEASKTYRIDLEDTTPIPNNKSNPFDPFKPLDPFIRTLRDGNGNIINNTFNDNWGNDFDARVYYKPEDGGTYYIVAGGYKGTTGTYNLTIVETDDALPDPVTDDFDQTLKTTGVIISGSPTSGSIEKPNDKDWFAASLQAGTEYHISLLGNNDSDIPLSTPYLEGIYRQDGENIPNTQNNNWEDDFVFVPEHSGTYYLSVAGWNKDTGDYKLFLSSTETLPASDLSDDINTNGHLAVGSSVKGIIDYSGDQDWYRVFLPADTYQIDMIGSLSDKDLSLFNPFLKGIYDKNGQLINKDTVSDNVAQNLNTTNAQVIFTADNDEFYYISAGAFEHLTGTFNLSIDRWTDPLTPGDDIRGTTGTKVEITKLGQAVSGTINWPGDQDWFKVHFNAGKTYNIDLRGEPTGNGSLVDSFIYGIYDTNGNLIDATEDNDSGVSFNAFVEYTADKDGDYFIAAGGFDVFNGSYQLIVSIDDYDNSIDTSGTLSIGAPPKTGTIETSGDIDWFKVNLKEGSTYQIDLKGESTKDGTLRDPFLFGIYNSSGAKISSSPHDNDSGEGLNAQLIYTPTSSGDFYIAADGVGLGIGSYLISVDLFSV